MTILSPSLRSRYILAAVAGLLLTAAYPKIGIAGFAWLAPGLMIAAALGKRAGEVFRIGYIAGLSHYLSLLYWLLLIPYRWCGIPLGPIAGWLALSGFLALYPAVWVWLVTPRPDRPNSMDRAPSAEPERAGASLLFEGPGGVLARNWVRRTVWALFGAAAWVCFEMVLARFLGGFPWALLGVSQYALVPLLQVASVTGVYGVSFVVAWVSLALLSAGLLVIRRPTFRSLWVAELFLPLIVVALLFNYGFRILRGEPARPRSVRVTLVQPSIPQTVIWNPTNDVATFQELLRLTEQALTNKTDILVWPESAIPKPLRYDTNILNAVGALAKRHQVWMIVGSDDIEPSRTSSDPEAGDYFNSSFLIAPDGELAGRYTKRSLVIFGEYIPLEHWLPFMKFFTPSQGSFVAGTRPAEFDLRGLDVKISVLICFEDVFPQLGRSDVKPDTDFVVNITNDGWFDEGAAQWQQAVTALFRAVENRVPLVRCCNNGLTCWIDAQGRIRQYLRDDRGTSYGPGFLNFELPVMERGAVHSLTFYTRHGDWFGWSCAGIAGLMLMLKLAGRRKARAEKQT